MRALERDVDMVSSRDIAYAISCLNDPVSFAFVEHGIVRGYSELMDVVWTGGLLVVPN